jgi:hypothetical protein
MSGNTRFERAKTRIAHALLMKDGAETPIMVWPPHYIVTGAAKWYAESGDPAALDLATRLRRYCMLPRFWGGVPDPDGKRVGLVGHVAPAQPDPPFTPWAEFGHWYSLWHARAVALPFSFRHET